MLKLNYFLADIFILSAEKQPIKLSWRKIEWLQKVRRTINPGYVWTLPYVLKAKANGEEHPLKEYRMIFRREQVECFKYIKKEI